MPDTPNLSRRMALPGALIAVSAASASAKTPQAVRTDAAPASAFNLEPNAPGDQSARLQSAIDATTARGVALSLPPGRMLVSAVQLRPGTHVIGAAGQGTILSPSAAAPLLIGSNAHAAKLDGITLDGAAQRPDAARGDGLLVFDGSLDIEVNRVLIRNAALNGIVLRGCSGRLHNSTLTAIKAAAIFSMDAAGLDISHNVIADCADNGILVWRSNHGDDGTLLLANRISRIANASGGTGQYGNGINIYRANRVIVANCIVADCAYSAIRANEASDVQIVSNSVTRAGEVAIYAEAADERRGAAGFEGAVITSNIVDGAASGIVVTNYNNGGRLAVVQGNLVRNLRRRENETTDKRGEGIAIEADAVVSNNIIENAPTCGIMIGWGRHMRDVVATSNLIRKSRIGIAVTADGGAGQCLLSHNMISDAVDGAIRAMNHAIPIGADMVAGKGPRHVTLLGNIAV